MKSLSVLPVTGTEVGMAVDKSMLFVVCGKTVNSTSDTSFKLVEFINCFKVLMSDNVIKSVVTAIDSSLDNLPTLGNVEIKLLK